MLRSFSLNENERGWVEVSALSNQATAFTVGGKSPRKTGSAHPSIAPYGTVYFSREEEPLVLAIAANKSDLAERAVPVEAAQAHQCVPHTRTRTPSARFKHPHNHDPLHDGSMASRALLQAYAASIGAVLFETSAKEDVGVKELFTEARWLEPSSSP